MGGIMALMQVRYESDIEQARLQLLRVSGETFPNSESEKASEPSEEWKLELKANVDETRRWRKRLQRRKPVYRRN
jgi:hypothetical protein